MSYWQGIAKAVGEISDERFKERMVADERKFAVEQKAEDRKYEQETWEKRFQMETAASKQALREKLFFEGKLFGGETSAGGSRPTSGETISFKAFVEQHPELDEETVAMLAPYPDALALVHEELMGYKSGAPELGQIVDPTKINEFVRGIVPDSGEISEDLIREKAKLYGIDITDEEVSLIAARSGPPSATVITDPGALVATDPAIEKQLRDNISGELTGTLKDQERILRAEIGAGNSSPEIQSKLLEIQKLISVAETGNLRPVLNTPEGTGLIVEYLQSGYDVDMRRIFPGFVPHFNTEAQVQAAFDSGLIKVGDRVKMLQPDGTYKTVPINP